MWRPGQDKPCYIYRLVCTGTIEEKIYQRQVAKMALSTSIVESKAEDAVSSFNMAQLKDLFTLRTETVCDTHDLLCCRCCGKFNRLPAHLRNGVNLGELQTWTHFIDIGQIRDPVLRDSAASMPEGYITFMFRKSINLKEDEEVDGEDIVPDTEVQTEEVQFC
ncbi:MAG: hypothetical protein Q8P67_17515 [archaeon]|nr:hypothetical protein [archaeon]